MDPIDIYLMYCAMKAHFENKGYDFVKFNGKTKVSRNSFYKRNDRIFFVKLSRKYRSEQQIRDYLLANFIVEQKGWVGSFTEENYNEWLKRQQSLMYNFEQELSSVESIGSLLSTNGSNHPVLLKKYIGKKISLETMIMLDEITRFSKHWDKELEYDYVWGDVKKLMNNYKKFLTFSVEKSKMVLNKFL